MASSSRTSAERQRIFRELQFLANINNDGSRAARELDDFFSVYSDDLVPKNKIADDEELLANVIQYPPIEDFENELVRDKSWVTALHGAKCRVCNNLESRGHPDSRVLRSGSKIISFLELPLFLSFFGRSAMRSRECGYCDLLIRALDRAMPRSEWMEGVMAIVPERLTLVEDQPARLTATLFGKRTEIGVEIFKDLGSQIPELPVLGEAVPVANNPLSPASMTFVRQCLAECHSGHEDCRPLRIVMPKRLVYFERAAGPKKSSQQKRFRLKLLPFAVGSYAALSHSWGEQSDDMLKTTRTTEAEFMGNIDWDRLPKTLQDGITVAHEMGLQYIWIDSLCIVQDDKVEKSEEMPKMGGIYANAIITIAGSSSPGRVTSFLQDRPLLNRSVPVRFHGANGVSMVHRAAFKIGISPSTKLRVRRTSAIARKETMIAGFTRTDPLDPRISGPLSTRGWTLQERILSTRIAHFCEEGIVFECMSVVQHEDQRRSLPSLQSKWKGFDKRVLKGQDKDMRNDLQVFWREVLVEYTKRNLTYRTDILLAMSSIAARFYEFIGSNYYAGLWQDRIIEDLCWRPSVSGKEKVPFLKSEDSKLGLPSWSWTSIRYPISFATMGEPGVFYPHSKFRTCECRPAVAHSPFGNVNGRRLMLEGRMVEMKVSYHGQSRAAGATSAFLTAIDMMAVFQMVMDSPLVYDHGLGIVRRGHENDIPTYVEGSVWCLDLGRWEPLPRPFAMEGVDHHFVLVLGRSPTFDGAFERLGMVDSSKGSACTGVFGREKPQLIELV